MKSLVTCVTQTHKATSNQDFCGVVRNEKLNFDGVIVADGIGSHYKSELSSRFCTEQLKRKLESIDKIEDINFEALFIEIKIELKEYSKTVLSEDELKKNELGTTLICALQLEEEYIFAYVGNGSIWHLFGNFNHFGINRYLPWNSNNLLNPHTIEEEGKPALYKYISINESVSCKPTIIRLFKNEDCYGDIVLITSDGIYSNDEVKVGKDDNDIIWIMSEENLNLLYDKLRNFFMRDNTNNYETNLQNELNDYLTELRDKKMMHDDTTLGIIISKKVMDYQQNQLDELKVH